MAHAQNPGGAPHDAPQHPDGHPNSRRATPLPWGGILVLGIGVMILAIVGVGFFALRQRSDDQQQFSAFLNSGKAFYDQGDSAKAIAAFQKAQAMNPANPDVHLNLANAFLLADQAAQAASHAREAVHLEPGNPAGHYLLGCAFLRQNQHSNAVQSLQQAKDIDRTINEVSFQLGLAYAGMGLHEEAVEEFFEVIQFAPEHPSAFYQLSQSLLRLNRREEAAEALETHQSLQASAPQTVSQPGRYEKSVYTEIRAPFNLEQPDRRGIPVRFQDETEAVFGSLAGQLTGPLGVIDINRRAWNDLLVLDPEAGLRLLWNSNGVFQAFHAPLPTPKPAEGPAPQFHTLLVGDINNDRFEDVLLLGDTASMAIRFATNGVALDTSRLAQLDRTGTRAGALGDLDHTGRLSLFLADAAGKPRGLRGLGTFMFREFDATNGIPAQIHDIRDVVIDDWNNDDLMDVLLVRQNKPPLVLSNERGGGFTAQQQPVDWPVATALAVADFNNDFRTDFALVAESSIDIFFGGLSHPRRLPARRHQIRGIRTLDYDNDGWLDILTWGDDGLRLWRNRGHRGFREVTQDVGLQGLGAVRDVVVADLDQDGDSDLVIALASGGLRFLRNEGGNAHGMIKVRLLGNRSNASGLGVKLELISGNWRTLRSVQHLPIEIGTGRHETIDTLNVRWFDTQLGSSDVAVVPNQVLNLIELTIQQGSCPYLYAWDGSQYQFITDLLGSAPLGLPLGPGKLIEGDPVEYVRVGNQHTFPAVDGAYRIQITEELCEILYLDSVRLEIVDHPPDTEVFPTSKLVPAPPFPEPELWQLSHRRPLKKAITLKGRDVTSALQTVDGNRVSPEQIRAPQLRGLAEPHGVILDFGPLDADQPWVLALTGWLRFGGGMANVGSALRTDLPFPFPVLEAEDASGRWHPVPVVVGAPSGKTKGIVVSLKDKLPGTTQRLRLTQAFEIHWDRIALFQYGESVRGQAARASVADLHWRGYSELADLPWDAPHTPIHDRLLPQPRWRTTPSGWATRYGDVRELLAETDDALVLVAGGDALDLLFPAEDLPELKTGWQRTAFLHLVGWDKDADYHVVAGRTIDPLPWHGMDYQAYGHEGPPPGAAADWNQRTRTRWVGPRTFSRRSP